SDSGYHSQNNSFVKRNEYKQFNFHTSSITKVPKTGLGSSAGLVTVVTTCLVSVFKTSLDVNSSEDLTVIHNLSQIAHCQAQGKVGSGFDVAAATFGSIIYQRFDPALITGLPESSLANKDLYQESLAVLVNNTDWKIKNDRVSLPQDLRLFMGDVNSGSETTKLVAKVNEWYNSNLPESLEVYHKIDEGNLKFIEGMKELNRLSKENSDYYAGLLKDLSSGNDFSKYPELLKIKKAVEQIRSNFRRVTKESGADIEPQVQTELLDKCLNIKGVLTGMVPGAGGYDAISLITTKDTNIIESTKDNKDFANVTWLDLRQADIGIKEENPIHYTNLV
ncbi:hypothetical protein Kpol_1064p45, partial [Vanderwaltozyma polyspora DSM 70294]